MYHCKVCGHHISLNEDGKGYCPICDKEVGELDVVPTRCVDPIIQYCQGCRYGEYSIAITPRLNADGSLYTSK